MDLSTVLSAAQTLFAAVHRKDLLDMFSFLGYKSQLEDLQHTVSTVNSVLLDAENKEVDSHQAKLWIEELKDAVYDADDLFDKFVTIVQQEKLKKGRKASKKVSLFFSRYNPFGVAYNMSKGVKKIRQKLDAIAINHAKFGFKVDPQPIKLRREETCSYVRESNIIGREEDLEKIVEHLLNDTKKQVSYLTIVGIGGLGKTALAQLVYNDARVTSAFPKKIWTCVSDHDQEQLDVEQILRKILIAAIGENREVPTNMELLQEKVREVLGEQKYLLVLDDVWTENRNQWLKLEEFLLGGKEGSSIVLTTRSHETSRILGGDTIKHELQGLSKENSWCLFKKLAFGSEQSDPSDELVQVGQEIVEDCARVPLAIRVVGSLLYGQDKTKWLSFKKMGLSHSPKSKNDIMPILKLSYDQLESSIKSCFTYCALFQKDYELDVTQLKRLWMAQGYIVALNDGQSMEEAAEEYVSILLRRCFFQDARYNPYGGIRSCKIHDLMYDIALKVAEKEICVRNFNINDVNKKFRHLAYTSSELAELSFKEARLRSCLYVGHYMHKEDPKVYLSTSNLKGLLSKWKCLRALDLKYSGIKRLQESIGELLHLRYLDLHKNQNLEVLPKSLIKLYNLQTLLLGGCMKLKELPKDFIKLVNLRTLVIEDCGIRNLTCLGTLPQLKFLKLLGLEDLEYIDEDKGEVGGSISAAMPDGRLMIARGLLFFPFLEMLQLVDLPWLKGWGISRVEEMGDSSSNITPMLLPQLKTLAIEDCNNMKCELLLPKLEVLDLNAFNESLKINRLSKETRGTSTSTISCSSCCCYSLPELEMVSISGNVGWLNRMPVESFQRLKKLSIRKDDEIESIGEVEEVFRSCSSSLLSLEIHDCKKLRRVISGGLGYLSNLQFLWIKNCKLLSLSEEEERARDGIICIGLPPCPRFLHSLQHLRLQFLPKLVNLPNWMQYLSALQILTIINCEGLETMPEWIANIPSIGITNNHQKVVLKVDIHDDKKCKQIAMHLISSIPGVQSISINTQEGLITTTGDVDPVALVKKLRKKKYCTTIVAVGHVYEFENPIRLSK